MTNDFSRKELKKRGRQVFKTHYAMFVIMCLVVAMFGTEMGFIRSHAETLYDYITGQEVSVGGDQLKINTDSTRDKVLGDLIEDNIQSGRDTAAEQLKKYKDEKLSNTVTGRQRGILAIVANSFSSGNIYMTLFSGLHSVVHSSRAASAIVVIIALGFSVFIWIFIKNMLSAVLRRSTLEARTYSSVPISHLVHFKLVKRWVRVSLSLLFQSVYETLWMFTIIGYPIKRYAYFMVPYIVSENPDIKPREAIRLSTKLMYGHKFECFKIELSFLGWFILGSLTFGVTDALWSAPYRIATLNEYYVYIRSEAKKKNIEGSERLNDEYLFETADEGLLRETYHDIEEQKKYIDEHRVELTGLRRFFAVNFGLWTGTASEKAEYDDVDCRRQQIAEDRGVIKGKIYPERLNPLWDEKNNMIVRNIRWMRTYTIWSVIMIFFVFSFVGWLWEVSLHIVADGEFVNRGVLHGPWLPIYGGGLTLIVVLLAKWRSKPLNEVFSIVLLCGTVEFMTSYILEKTMGMRWWDYTGYFLNIDGRICAEGLIVFAIGGMLAVYLIIPILDTMWSKIKPCVLAVICIILLVCFSCDLVYSHFNPNTGEGITDYTAYEQAES